MTSSADIENRFAFHAATTQEKRDEHASVRQACRRLADFINENVPSTARRSPRSGANLVT